MQKIKDFGKWLLNYIPPKPKVVDNVLESIKNKIKKMYEKTVQICFEKCCESASNKRSKWIRPRIISA